MRMSEQIPGEDKTESMRTQEKQPFFSTRKGQSVSTLLMIVFVVVFLLVRMNSDSGEITYQLDDAHIGLVCLDEPAVFINYDDVTQLESVDSFEQGEALETREWNEGWCGTYQNEEYGQYLLYAYSGVGNYIVLRTANQTVVFNAKSESETDRLYQELCLQCASAT